MVIENFSEFSQTKKEIFYEGECFLKTKSDRLKKHWCVIVGNDIFCFRRKEDEKHRVMHSLIGTYLKDCDEESVKDTVLNVTVTFWPVKIVLPPNKSRVLYF
jgi:hypothetical protein